MNEFHDLADLSAEQIKDLLTLAGRLQKNPEPRALEGKILALLFMSPSLRTLASFQAAMSRLGGGSFVISPDMSIHGLETRPGIVMDGMAAEHIREAIPVIASYADALGIRAFAERRSLDDDVADKEFNNMRKHCNVPLINMESAINHPCQSLADWKTMDELGIPANGGKFVLSWAYHPRHAAPGRARRNRAHGGHARHGRDRITARRIRTAAELLMDKARSRQPRQPAARSSGNRRSRRRGAGRRP